VQRTADLNSMGSRRNAAFCAVSAVVSVAAPLMGAVPAAASSGPDDSSGAGITIGVRVPETVWNTPNQFAMSVLANGDVRVVDSRADSPGWTKAVQTSGQGRHERLTVTVLS
jgi:hypothetical protein